MFKNSALELLSEYNDGSSDEEVPSGRISIKREHRNDDNDDINEPNLKRFERLPLPDCMKQNSITRDDYIDDPALHGGRIRSFPHERGNWATFVYISCDLNEGLEKLTSTIIDKVGNNLELKIVDDFHISLTKTVILRYHWIVPFVANIKQKLIHFHKFLVMFSSINIYCNDERTRTFIGLQIRTGYDSLLNLIHLLDDCLKDFNLPPFYKDPSFHMSILWCFGDHETELKLLLSEFNNILENILQDYPQDNWYIYVEKILCKTGNKLYQFNLN